MTAAKVNLVAAFLALVGGILWIAMGHVVSGLIWLAVSVVWLAVGIAKSRQPGDQEAHPVQTLVRKFSRLFLWS